MANGDRTQSLAEAAKDQILDPLMEHPAALSMMKAMAGRPYLATFVYFNVTAVLLPVTIYLFYIVGVAIFSLAAAALFVLFWAAVGLAVLVPCIAVGFAIATCLWLWACAIYQFLSLFIVIENPFRHYSEKDSDVDAAEEDFSSHFPRQDLRPFARPRIPDPSQAQTQTQLQAEDENLPVTPAPATEHGVVSSGEYHPTEPDRTNVTEQQQQGERAGDAAAVEEEQATGTGNVPDTTQSHPPEGNLTLNGDIFEESPSQRAAGQAEGALD